MAKIIAFGKSYEPLEIDLGGTVVTARIDLRDSTIDKNFKALRNARADADKLMGRLEALDADDAKEAERLAKGMADLLQPVICSVIGDESYNEILTACGDGEPVPPEEANMLMTLVFAEIEAVMVDRFQTFRQNKAAHYLKELANAQAEPHKA